MDPSSRSPQARRFQLPLSGSLTVYDFSSPGHVVVSFQLPLSGSHLCGGGLGLLQVHFQLPLSGSPLLRTISLRSGVARLSTPSFGITSSTSSKDSATSQTFNSLFRDHESEDADSRVHGSLSTPSFGITRCCPGSCRSRRSGRLSTPSFGITGFSVGPLGGQDLVAIFQLPLSGSLFAKFLLLRSLFLAFQLPLSGSHSAARTFVSLSVSLAFNSLFRDHRSTTPLT